MSRPPDGPRPSRRPLESGKSEESVLGRLTSPRKRVCLRACDHRLCRVSVASRSAPTGRLRRLASPRASVLQSLPLVVLSTIRLRQPKNSSSLASLSYRDIFVAIIMAQSRPITRMGVCNPGLVLSLNCNIWRRSSRGLHVLDSAATYYSIPERQLGRRRTVQLACECAELRLSGHNKPPKRMPRAGQCGTQFSGGPHSERDLYVGFQASWKSRQE